MFKGKVLLFSLLMVFATSLYAGDVNECESEASMSCAQMRISICPAGDFETFRTACTDASPNGHVIVYVRDDLGNPIADVPWTDYWFNACDIGQELCLCASPIVADSLTNLEGRTTFSGSIAGGGCVLTGGIYVACQGKTFVDKPECLVTTCLDMQVVSPDYTGNCLVDLSDLSFFGDSYNMSLGDPPVGDKAYDDCCDYTDDTNCDLSDFSFFGEHYLHECF